MKILIPLFIIVFLLGACKSTKLNSISSTKFNSDIRYDSIKDIEGTAYKTVKIGVQEWMAENLKTTKYKNGDDIITSMPFDKDLTEDVKPKFQWAYDAQDYLVVDYGRLYTWYIIEDSRGVCPAGWHVPTKQDWSILSLNLGGEKIAGSKLKEADTLHWGQSNLSLNTNGFTALPAGFRYNLGAFSNLGDYASWWTMSDDSQGNAWIRFVKKDEPLMLMFLNEKNDGHAIRCIKD